MSAYSIIKSALSCQCPGNVLRPRFFSTGKPLFLKKDLTEYHLRQAKPYKSIPCVPILPVIGSAWAYFPYIGRYNVEEMHKADVSKYQTYGDIVRERFGRTEVVNSYNPDSMYTMIDYEEKYPSRGDFATLKVYRKKRTAWYQPTGLLVAEGEEWSILRKKVEEYITDPRYCQYYIEPMTTMAKYLVSLIRVKRDDKEELDDAVSYLNRWALEAVAHVALDERLGCLDHDWSPRSDGMKMMHSINTQLYCMNKLEASAGNLQLWKFLPTPTWRKFVKAADVFTSLALKHIARSTRSRDFWQLKPGKHPSLLQYLTRYEKMGVSSAMVLLCDLMMSGVDTTSCAAGFLLYNLATNPKIQQKVIKEIHELLPNKEDNLTFEVYEKFEYLRNCLKESMRLHPVVRGNVRKFQEDLIISGYRIPAGTPVISVLQVIFKNSKYFPYPNEFRPERWYDERQHYSFYQPFGYGVRKCVGSKLAELEILTMTIEVLRNFTLEYHYEEVGMKTKLTNVPDRALKLRFVENTETEICS